MPQAEIPPESHHAQRLEGWREQLSAANALPQLTLLGLVTGILAGLVIVAFRLLVEMPLHFMLPLNSENFEGLSLLGRFALPLFGAVTFGLVLQFIDTKYHAASVGHVLDRIHNHQARLPLGNSINQMLGGAWCLITGQSVGREGPAVHLGASCGSLLGQWLHLPNNTLRPLAGCGVAAAIAACFNTPLAGVIFAMEVVIMQYSIAGFIPVTLAAIAGTIINQMVFGTTTIFHPPATSLYSLLELPFVVTTGLITAAFATLFIQMQTFSCKLSTNKPITLRFTAAGIVAGSIAIFTPQIMGVGYDTIDSALANNIGFWLFLGILFAKLIVTSISLGVGMPGGVIGPLLFIGACIGGLTGLGVNQIMPSESSSASFYVLLGMGAMMGAVLNAPLAAIMTILELTYNPNIIFPSMLVVITASLTTRWGFRCEGLFQTLLTIQGKKSSFNTHEQLLNQTGIRNLLDNNVKLSPNQLTYQEATAILEAPPNWLILQNPLSLLRSRDLANYIAKNMSDGTIKLPHGVVDLLDNTILRLNVITLNHTTTLYNAIIEMNDAHVDAAIIHLSNQKLGVLTREQIESYYKLK